MFLIGNQREYIILNVSHYYTRATSIVKNSNKERYVYRGHGMTFDTACSWIFDNDTARNVITFGVDNGSSSHAENAKNDFLLLGEGPIYGTLFHQRKSLGITLVKQTRNFAWISFIMPIIVICLLMEKKSLNIKPTMKMLTFWLGFVPEAYLMDLVLLTLEKYL